MKQAPGPKTKNLPNSYLQKCIWKLNIYENIEYLF